MALGAKLMRSFCGLAIIWLAICGLAMPAAAAPAVDLQIVLAVDASRSIDEREYAMQLARIAAAVRDPAVLAAIRKGPAARIGIALATWAEPRRPEDATPWYLIQSGRDAERFARAVEARRCRVGGGTGIGHAVLFCTDLFRSNGFAGGRRVIEISGDGRETVSWDWNVTPMQARAAAETRGITVNGLALLSEDADLAAYCADQVTAGAGAFVMTALPIDDFVAAFRRKLIREIEDRNIVSQQWPAKPAIILR